MEIYLSLCEAVRDISGVQRHLSTLRSLCVFLPEVLDAALWDRVPSFLRRELTKVLIAVVDDRGGKFPYNAKALGDILRGDDYRPSAEGATHTLRRFEGTEVPSSLEAFCHLFDRCGDMTTQVNVAKAFVLVVKHGEIDQELIARFLGQNLREHFSALVRGMFRVDEFRESLYALVGEYDVSRGSSASVLSVVCESIRIGVVESRHYPFVEFGREGISVYHLFPGDAKDSVGILVDFPYAGCLRKVTRVGRELRLGVRAKPRGFGTDDAWDPDDDKWVIIKFPARGWSVVQNLLLRASKSYPDLLRGVVEDATPAESEKQSRGVVVRDAPVLPRLRVGGASHLPFRAERPSLPAGQEVNVVPTVATDVTSPRDTVEELPANLTAMGPSEVHLDAAREAVSPAPRKHLHVEDSPSTVDSPRALSPKTSRGKAARDEDEDDEEDDEEEEDSDFEIAAPKTRGNRRNTRSAAAAAKKAKEAKAGGEAKTTEGQKKAGQSKSAKADKKSDSPVPARRTTRASAKYAARRKIVAKEDGEEEDVVPESQEPLPTARPEDLTYDAFVAANAKARGDAPPTKAAEARPEWWSPRGDDKTTPFSNKFDLSKPLRKMTRRGKTLPPAPIEAAANEKFSAVAERPREDEGSPARVDEPEPKAAAKRGLLRVKTSRDAVAAAEPIAQVAPVVPLEKCVPDTAYKSAAPPAATPLGARLASGKKKREAPARNTRAKRAKTRADEGVSPPMNPSKVVKRAARAEPEPEPEPELRARAGPRADGGRGGRRVRFPARRE